MNILNKKDRLKALSLFVLFFFFTLGIALVAIFFNAYFPFKENELLKSENQKLVQEFKFLNTFSYQLESVKQATDSIGEAGTNDFFNEQLALSKLADMYKELPKNDSIQTYTLYNNTILGYKEIIDLKKKMLLEDNKSESFDTILLVNKKLMAEVQKLKTDLEVCRQINRIQ